MAKDNSRLRKLKQDALALWDDRLHGDKEPSRLHKFLHFWVLVVKSFNRNRCPIRASALSFLTLLAFIPVLAVTIGVTSILLKKQGEDQIYQLVDKFVSSMIPPAAMTNGPSARTPESSPAETNSMATETPPSEIAQTNSTAGSETNETPAVVASPGGTNTPPTGEPNDRVVNAQKEAAHQIHNFIQSTSSGALGFTGMFLLLVVGIRMLGSIEATFNDIWGVTRGRNLLSRVQIYCTAVVVGPFLLVGAAALTGGPHLQTTQKIISEIPLVGPLIFPLLTFVVLWLAFALFYQFVPNTKVRFKAALVGGIVAGTVWHLNNLFGFLYVSRVVTNGKIYGKLALVPVFMAGVYLGWYILLFGAQVAYAFQNRKLYLQERLAENVNQRGREFVAMRLMTFIGQRFQRGLPPPTGHEMSEDLSIPSRLVQQVLQTLIASHLATEVSSGIDPAYTPARPLEQINAHHILQAMRARGQELHTRHEPVREEVYGEFARIQEAEKQAASSITMLSLVNRADARLELVDPSAPEKEIEISPALVPRFGGTTSASPTNIPPPEPAPTSPPQQPVETQTAPPPSKPEPQVAPETPKTQSKPPEPVAQASAHKPIAEPITDDERDFPL